MFVGSVLREIVQNANHPRKKAVLCQLAVPLLAVVGHIVIQIFMPCNGENQQSFQIQSILKIT